MDRGLLGQAESHLKGKDRTVFAHHEEVEAIHALGRAFHQIQMAKGEGVAVDDDGSVMPLGNLGGMAGQVVLQAGSMLQQRSFAVGDQQTKIQGLEAGHVLRQGEDEHGVVPGGDRR